MIKNKIKKIDFLFPEEKFREDNELPFPTMKCDNFLYHYSDIDAVISIIEEKKIWLMEYESLNDRSEGKLLYDAFRKILRTEEERKRIEEIY